MTEYSVWCSIQRCK